MIKFNLIFKQFLKNRDKILENKQYLSILIYFILFFIMDYFGIFDYYGQSIFRRSINMYRRTDPLNYQNKLKPFCQKYDKILDKNDIIKLQSIKIPETKDFSILTRKNTTTHQCCEKYSKNEIEIIENISEKIRQKYQNKINKKLYYLENNKATIYRYHGNKSHHLWHVDPQNISEIYNIIICIKKKGNISPLQCKNKAGNEYSIHFEEGDGALFTGGTTIHQVPPNDDPNSERTVLSIAFTSDKKISKNKNMSNNLCTYTEGGNNYINIIKIFLSGFLINYILTKISGINHLSYSFILVFYIINLLIAKYIPYYFDIGLGTARSSSIYNNLIILLIFIIASISIKGAMIFSSYFLISDVFFSRKWVEYN
mgnify:CR=1 FL=1|uniref:Uncharacterized protein n=1 Tax=viral metagenome TaxID=1070528 RepID=A0A6C0F9Q2_9ZZZZ|tara:strand:- start:8784 stop:9893 length:1110 start_codon:yes stop_codon:yes gene_type:complete